MKSLLGLVDAEEDDVFKECLQKVNAHFHATHNRLTQAETADTFIAEKDKQYMKKIIINKELCGRLVPILLRA